MSSNLVANIPTLETNALTYTYHAQTNPSFQNISLIARAGECWLVTGASGCGKSTLARCLVGLIPHLYHGELRGTVSILGSRTDATPLWQLAENAGMVLQNTQAQMLASTVEDEIAFGLENLGLARAEIAKRIEENLDRFGLQKYRAHDPRRLSGGEGQRVMLAAMLSRQPPLLVLDEPLSMLDTTAARELVQHLIELAQRGTAIVVCEHRSRYFETNTFHEFALEGKSQTYTDPSPIPLSPAADFKLSIKNLSVAFKHPVLDQISLDLASGEIVALVGVNGSGKTTLLRSILGLQRHPGSITVSDQSPLDLGLVYQNSDLQLFNPTVREEILYRVQQPDDNLYRWLITQLGLERYESASPLLLSEGEKKRLCLAMVLMHQPRHGVLLDEPTLGQDDHHRVLLGRAAQQLANAGHLVVVATHDLAWAAHYATRMLVMHQGKILADGSPQKLLRDSQLWQCVGLDIPSWIWEPIG